MNNTYKMESILSSNIIEDTHYRLLDEPLHTTIVYIDYIDILSIITNKFDSIQPNNRIPIYCKLVVEHITACLLLEQIESTEVAILDFILNEVHNNPDAENYFTSLSVDDIYQYTMICLYQIDQQVDSYDQDVVIGGWVTNTIMKLYIRTH